MKQSDSSNSQVSPQSPAPPDAGSSPWRELKGKNIAYLTLPLLVMATIVEFVILATGWKYQQMVCLPQGMGVTFFGIGPIGATILAVELLKLPLAIWTASRQGWQKGFMLIVGLPLICVLTFQLVKDMAVYEMTTAMAPAGQLLEKAAAEEINIAQFTAEMANQTKDDGNVETIIKAQQADRDRRLAELDAKHANAKAALEQSLERNDGARRDAITLTDYQQKELSEVEARQGTLIKQFDADAQQLTKDLTGLRARREIEVSRATTWNAEEARIENAYKTKLADYTNAKAAYEKDKTEYDAANFIKRRLMKEPVDPGVAPERESNKILKPTLVAELDEQIKGKEAELAAVNTKRRDSVAQVGTDARRLREEFDRRSGTKREETDRAREELLASLALLVKERAREAAQIDQAYEVAVQKERATLTHQRPVDVIRTDLDESRKKADAFYEAREASIRDTQVHRIATTVEIARGLLLGERPLSITATAKERGDLLTDQISMVRIWVYPVLAFIVAFLPTLMVEIGCSTIFKPEQQQPSHRLGFLGRRLHWLYTRAGRQKILRAERLAREASAEIAARDEALTAANAARENALARKNAELQVAYEAIGSAAAAHEKQLTQKESEWNSRLADVTASLNEALVEKDALVDFQQAEIERQLQLRQDDWSDRLAEARQELDAQRAANEAERSAMVQEHQKKLAEVSDAWRTQVAQVRRQMAEADTTAQAKSAKVAQDLREALKARDAVCSQLQLQAESLSIKLTQAQEDAARESEKTARQEKHRLERQQLEVAKTLRQSKDEFELQWKQREQELSLELNTQLAEEQARVEQNVQAREEEFERLLAARILEVEERWKQEVQRKDDMTQLTLKQRDQQGQAEAAIRLRDVQTASEEKIRRRELDFERELDAHLHETNTRLREELQQQELAFHAKLKQREQEFAAKAAARETEMQNQWNADLRAREEHWTRQTESRVRGAEVRSGQEIQQQEELFQIKLRQREQQLQSQFDARLAEMNAEWNNDLHGHEQEWERNQEASVRATEARWSAELQQKEELFQSKLRQRDQHWQAKLDSVRVESQAQSEQEQRRREADSAETHSRALRELEARLRKEIQDHDETAQAEAKQLERNLSTQLTAQAKAHEIAQKQWETELEITRGSIEPFKASLARAEKERDEARHAAAEGIRKVNDLEKKLMEASTFLASWKQAA